MFYKIGMFRGGGGEILALRIVKLNEIGEDL